MERTAGPTDQTSDKNSVKEQTVQDGLRPAVVRLLGIESDRIQDRILRITSIMCGRRTRSTDVTVTREKESAELFLVF